MQTVNVKLTLEYDGKNYSGWQRQKNKKTIQQTIEDTLQVLIPVEKIKLIGAGRTDSGVHALAQVANFKVNKALINKLDLHKIVRSLNAMMPSDIAVRKAQITGDDFHSRYSAKKRIYRYNIVFEKRALGSDKFFHYKGKFDFLKAQDFCIVLKGLHSFRGLCKNPEDKHDFVCNVFYAKVMKAPGRSVVFEICANRFLHSMVRAIVGMMLGVASGKFDINDFTNKFSKGEKLKSQYVPANALVLMKVIY